MAQTRLSDQQLKLNATASLAARMRNLFRIRTRMIKILWRTCASTKSKTSMNKLATKKAKKSEKKWKEPIELNMTNRPDSTENEKEVVAPLSLNEPWKAAWISMSIVHLIALAEWLVLSIQRTLSLRSIYPIHLIRIRQEWWQKLILSTYISIIGLPWRRAATLKVHCQWTSTLKMQLCQKNRQSSVIRHLLRLPSWHLWDQTTARRPVHQDWAVQNVTISAATRLTKHYSKQCAKVSTAVPCHRSSKSSHEKTQKTSPKLKIFQGSVIILKNARRATMIKLFWTQRHSQRVCRNGTKFKPFRLRTAAKSS